MLSESHTDQQPIMAAFILSSPPLSVAGYGEGAYRGVQKPGLHSYGLFSLMVKTFCSGSSQAHCRDSAFCIHEMSKTQNRTYEGKNERGKKARRLSRKDSPPQFMLQRASNCHRKWSYQPWVRCADQWTSRSVKSCRILFIRNGRV